MSPMMHSDKTLILDHNLSVSRALDNLQEKRRITESSLQWLRVLVQLQDLQELGNVVPIGNASATPHVVSNDIYVTLGDLGKVARVGEDGCSFSSLPNSVCATGQMPRGDDGQYLELDDLGELFNYHDSTHTGPPSVFGEPQTLLGEMPFQGETS